MALPMAPDQRLDRSFHSYDAWMPIDLALRHPSRTALLAAME
jgi:hypothetical protein